MPWRSFEVGVLAFLSSTDLKEKITRPNKSSLTRWEYMFTLKSEAQKVYCRVFTIVPSITVSVRHLHMLNIHPSASRISLIMIQWIKVTGMMAPSVSDAATNLSQCIIERLPTKLSILIQPRDIASTLWPALSDPVACSALIASQIGLPNPNTDFQAQVIADFHLYNLRQAENVLMQLREWDKLRQLCTRDSPDPFQSCRLHVNYAYSFGEYAVEVNGEKLCHQYLWCQHRSQCQNSKFRNEPMTMEESVDRFQVLTFWMLWRTTIPLCRVCCCNTRWAEVSL